MPGNSSIREQLHRNLVAIISLVVALTSLIYTTWRNEVTELNRNVRHGGFELMMQAAKLRELTYLLRYDPEQVGDGAERSGWVIVIAMDDLSSILPERIQVSTDELRATWAAHSASLHSSEADDGIEAIDAAVDALVAETVATLDALD